MQTDEKEPEEVTPQKDRVILVDTASHDIDKNSLYNKEESQQSNTYHDNYDTGDHDLNYMTTSTADQVTQSCHDNTDIPLPRRKSSVWVMMKKKMSVTDKEATPIKWKMILLVFLALVGFLQY